MNVNFFLSISLFFIASLQIYTKITNFAKKIRELKEAGTKVYDVKTDSMREMRYSDVAILLRSMTNSRDVVFQKALKNEGIQGYVISKSGYYNAWEVQLILNFLSVIDNPRQDIPQDHCIS